MLQTERRRSINNLLTVSSNGAPKYQHSLSSFIAILSLDFRPFPSKPTFAYFFDKVRRLHSNRSWCNFASNLSSHKILISSSLWSADTARYINLRCRTEIGKRALCQWFSMPMADTIWCEIAVIEIQQETPDPKASQPLATRIITPRSTIFNSIDVLPETYLLQLNEPQFTNFR